MTSRTIRHHAFTLTEMLVVIGILLLLLVLALPAFNFITGSRSIDGAQNQISALLGRARAEAIGLQEHRGVMFYIDPANERVTVALVREADYPAGAPMADVYLDLVGDTDVLTLPPGVGLQVIDDCAVAAGVRGDDGYLGFNDPGGGILVGGVILFDSNGQLAPRTYGIRTTAGAGATTLIEDRFNLDGGAGGAEFVSIGPPATPSRAQFGFVLFDRDAFTGWGGALDDAQISGAAYGTVAAPPSEAYEEDQIDKNATPLLVNRYNGTLIRSE
ncbi:MAG: prepilin-type N-terminal cleavage/methylation domain-containing protein [Tepidisphaeraceae bacterium]